MRSSYKRIGNYIELVDERNTDLKVTTLVGLSITKKFIPSVANTVGTDMANYKIIRMNQFACSLMQVRRDKKIPVALLRKYNEAIISQAYPVFQVIDENELLPEYLMMWMSRSEFDRHACFLAVGGVRGSLEWEDFLDMELPIPSIEKQREIVKEYNTVVNLINLNKQLNQKLEETAQALYKHWFVDFDFPNESGKPYKSSEGKMVWNEELKKKIPEGWSYTSIQTLIENNIIFKNQDGNHGEVHPKSSDFVTDGIPFIMAKDLEFGSLDLKECSFITKEHSSRLRIKPARSGDVLLTHKATMGRVAFVPKIEDHVVLTPQVTFYRVKNEKKINKEFLYCLFKSVGFQQVLLGESEQSTRNFMSITNQRLLKIIFPIDKQMNQFKLLIKPIVKHKEFLYKENVALLELQNIINSKMARIETEKEVV